MTIRTPDEAVTAALAQHTNVPDTCQMTVHEWFNAPSAGDQDGDGDADAVDGWESEPVHARHPGNTDAPAGHPVAWSGGSHGNGHRALSLGKLNHDGVTWIRSTDAGGSGIVATVPLSWVAEHWGLHYLGWSETIDGQPIPPNPIKVKPAPKPAHEPTRVEQAHDLLDKAAEVAHNHGNDHRAEKIQGADDELPKR